MKFFRSRWQRKQNLASPARYYGDGGTIHSTGTVDIELSGGRVVAVWFRCQQLAFNQVDLAYDKYGGQIVQGARLTGVEVVDEAAC